MLGMFEARHSSRILCWLIVVDTTLPDIGRRKLFGVADNDHLAATSDGADRVPDRDASSKITTSKGLASAGRYCAIDSGLIMTQGASWVMTLGIRPNSWRSGICRAFLLISRASVPHSGSLPKFVWVGTETPIRVYRLIEIESALAYFESATQNLSLSCGRSRWAPLAMLRAPPEASTRSRQSGQERRLAHMEGLRRRHIGRGRRGGRRRLAREGSACCALKVKSSLLKPIPSRTPSRLRCRTFSWRPSLTQHGSRPPQRDGRPRFASAALAQNAGFATA
jgi:hypothetical protein